MRIAVAISTIYYDDDDVDDVVVRVVHADYDGEGQKYCYY